MYEKESVTLECLGGPMDGQMVSFDRHEFQDAISMAIDTETGQPHFYVLQRSEGEEFEIGDYHRMLYLGSDIRRVIEYLRRHNSPLVDQLEAKLASATEQGEPFAPVDMSFHDKGYNPDDSEDDSEDEDEDGGDFNQFSKL
jgi:hypothetical protein